MLMLLDAAGLYFRAFHGTPESITAPDGTPVNAVRGFLDMTASLVSGRRPTGLVACWDDDWRPAWRVELVPAYKAHRVAQDGGQEEPESLSRQVEIIVEVLSALGLARVGAPGYEADDVLATLARRAASQGQRVEVVTGDRDLVQLVDDGAGIRVLYIGRGIRRMDVLDEAAVRAAYGVEPARYVDLSVLRGDPSDGLPGVPGIGAKTAADLITRFHDLPGVLGAVAEGAPGIRPTVLASLRESSDYVRRAEQVVRAATVPLPTIDPAIPATAADPERVAELGRRWGLTSSLRRLTAALSAAVADPC